MPSSTLANYAILFAVPLTFDDYVHRVKRQSNWLGKFWIPDADPEVTRQSLTDSWKNEYLPMVAQQFWNLAAHAHGFGADIRTRVTLKDLRTATASNKIVIIFAHWKDSEVSYDDLRNDREAFLTRALSNGSLLGHWIHARLLNARHESGVDDILNEALRASLPVEGLGEDLVREADVTRSARRRDEIDSMFEGLLWPGNRLELYDGLHDKQAIRDALAPTFTGVLDLAACNSTLLAFFLAGASRHRFLTVQYPQPLDFLWAGLCTTRALELVSNHSHDYQSARLRAAKELEDSVRQLEHKEGFMTTVKTVAERLLKRGLEAGGQMGPATKKALRELRKRQKRFYVIYLILHVSLACLCAFWLLFVRNDGWRLLGWLSGALTSGSLFQMQRYWRDWARADLLLILIYDASEAEITRILQELAKKL
jgi:hypothetical protein